MDNRDDRNRTGAAPAKRNWIPYAIGAAILALLLFVGLRSCTQSDDDNLGTRADATANGDMANAGMAGGADAGMVAGGAAGGAAVAGANGGFTAEGLRGYLQGTGAAPAEGQVFGLDRVTFDTGSAQLDQQDLAVVAEAAGVLKQFPDASVTITGYADPAGDAAANRKLAAQRAVAVKQAMAAQGLPAAKLLTDVVGETGNAPMVENRRVELRVRR